jgi:hypothetical protein
VANTIVKVPVPEVGTYTLELYGKDADTLLNSDGADTLTRLTNNKSWATATVTEAVTGVNLARVRNAANDGVGYFFTESMADDTNTYLCVEVDPTTVDAVNTAVALIVTDTGTTIPALINTLGANSIGTVTRATDDQTPLSFVWPVTGAATALGTNSLVSIDDGATFAAITGAITELGLIDGKYWYQIAFNGADRPAAQGVSWFRILDGTYTKFFNLTIPSIAIETSVQSTLDRLGFTLAALAGNCADPQTAAETYSIILGANTFTIDHTGLDATGTRTTATLTKS